MRVITFASSKGGAGKTTSAIVIGTTMARHSRVTLIDADPAQRLMSWAGKAELPKDLIVIASKGEDYIQQEIDRALASSDIVLIDLEGAATRLNAYAMAESDLVIIPMGDEQQDAEGAMETLAQLARESRMIRHEIPVRILFCRTKAAVKSRLAKSLNAQIRDKIGSFHVELNDRTAFSSLHNLGGTLYDMKSEEIGGLEKAIANAEALEQELQHMIQTIVSLQEDARLDQARIENQPVKHGLFGAKTKNGGQTHA